jgi:predicted RecA/RadA family phage recombinase
MGQADLRSGSPIVVDYTPTAAVAAGDVVVVGDYPFIAHLAIAANKLGALAAGGAEYKVTANAAIAAGKKVYWDDTNNKVTETATANTPFGFVSPHNAAAADGDLIDVVHCPTV